MTTTTLLAISSLISISGSNYSDTLKPDIKNCSLLKQYDILIAPTDGGENSGNKGQKHRAKSVQESPLDP